MVDKEKVYEANSSQSSQEITLANSNSGLRKILICHTLRTRNHLSDHKDIPFCSLNFHIEHKRQFKKKEERREKRNEKVPLSNTYLNSHT